MKNTVFLTILFVIVLGGCAKSAYEKLQNANFSAIEQQCKDLEGKPVEAAYKVWGSPKSNNYSGDYKVLHYVDYISYKGFLVTLKRDVFVKDGTIKICKFGWNAAR